MNTWVYVFIAMIAIIVMIKPKSKQVEVGSWISSNFEISPESRKMFDKMKRDELGHESLKKFAMMEDRFLEYEKESACMGRDRVLDATGLDQSIREAFGGYDFTYHNNHLKQVAETRKVINPYLKCHLA